MLKSTTNADCPYFFIQGYLSSLEFNHRAALAVIIKVIKELVCRHDFSPSLCRFGLGLSMKNKKSAILLCPNGTTNADCPYFFIQGYLSSLEFNHRAALAVIIKVIKELVCINEFFPSLYRFGLGLSMKNKKSAILLCPNGTTNAD